MGECVCPPSRVSQLPPLCSPTTHLRFTLCLPLLNSAHLLLRHCSLPLSRPPVLVTLSVSCQLELVNFRRRTPAGWRGARAGSLGCRTGCRDSLYPLPRRFRIKHRLLPSSFLFFPSYLSTLVISFCYSSRSTPPERLLCSSQDIPLRYLGTLSFPSLPYIYTLRFIYTALSIISNTEEEVPGGFPPASSREGL